MTDCKMSDHLANFERAVTHVLDRMGSDGTSDLRAAIIGAARALDEEHAPVAHSHALVEPCYCDGWTGWR